MEYSGGIHDLEAAPEAPSSSWADLSPSSSSPRQQQQPQRGHSFSEDSSVSHVSSIRRQKHQRQFSAPGRMHDFVDHGQLMHHPAAAAAAAAASPSLDATDEDDGNNTLGHLEQNLSQSDFSWNEFLGDDDDEDIDYSMTLDQCRDDDEVDEDYTSSSCYDDHPPSNSTMEQGLNSATTTNNNSTQYTTRGAILPLMCGPCMTRASSCIVQKAPCFWCSQDSGTTDRSVLVRLNVLCAFFALAQIGAGVFLVTVLYSTTIVDRYGGIVQRQSDGLSNAIPIDLWNLNGSVILTGLLACILFGAVIYTLRVVRNVNLRGAVRYLWTLVWLLPCQIFLVISLFDYHRVMEVWVRHWWYLPIMAWFRLQFCADGTYNNECMVPVHGNPEFSTEEEWCAKHFESVLPHTKCREIRDAAQATMNRLMYYFYTTCGVWGLVLICLLFFAISLLENIITRPIVQTSRESNVPGWMLLPIVGCFTAGSVLLFSPSSVVSGSSEFSTSNWVGVLYVIAGGCFFISASLGWFIGSFSILNSTDKRNKNLAVVFFIGINIFLVAVLAAIFSGGIVIATSIIDVPLSDKQVGRAACDIDAAESCSDCGNRFGEQECPEWTKDQVLRVLNTQYKSSATFAAIFMIYAFSALKFGIGLRRHITMYQIDYI